MNKKQKILLLQNGSWSPAQLNPLVWYDNGPEFMAADGSQWTDRASGLNVTQAVSGNRPVYTANVLNGKPAFVFDGVDDFMSRAALPEIKGIANMTIWAVGKVYVMGQSSGAADRSEFFHYTDFKLYALPDYNVGGGFGTKDIGDIYNYSVYIFDGTQITDNNKIKLYANGALQNPLNITSPPIPNLTSVTATNFEISRFANSAIIGGQVLEAGIVNRSLSPTEITNLNAYLAVKYAL